MSRNCIVGIDFDGTLAARCHPYPAIGRDLDAAPWLHGLVHNSRVTLVLWTMREGEALIAAVNWCRLQGIYFDGLNEVPGQGEWTNKTDGPCRKQHFSVLVDDCALGCPIRRPALIGWIGEDRGQLEKPFVDWNDAGPMLIRTVKMWLDAHPEEA